jgi:hypothetical protein
MMAKFKFLLRRFQALWRSEQINKDIGDAKSRRRQFTATGTAYLRLLCSQSCGVASVPCVTQGSGWPCTSSV